MPSQHSSLFGYTIADLLNDVKNKFKDTFSADVYQHLNTVREKNDFSDGLRYQLKNNKPDDVTTRAEAFFGTTYNWKETGYILTNGKRLDFSGKKDGAPVGQRSMDHREIIDGYSEEMQNELSGSEAMIDFMKRGNIRVSPEMDGINLSVMPTKEQKSTLREFITRARGEIVLDIDNEYGDTEISVEYPRGTSGTKILNDIKQYFENGIEPSVSEISQFRYQLKQKDVDYMTAVDRGDMVTAQALVDEAAERNFKNSKARDFKGKLIKVYHGTESEDFYEFDKTRQGQTDSSLWGRGYYFSSDSEFAEMFGDNVRSFFLNITNPFTVSKVDAPAGEIADKFTQLGEKIDFDYKHLKAHEFANAFGNQKFSDVLASHGYDGVIVGDVRSGDVEYVAFEQNQMKLSDPVTYDDKGNIIPLSERFDDSKVDIRYQKKNSGINTDYSDLSKLDSDSLKVYNDRGWARGLFTKEDNALLNRRLGEIFRENSKYVRTALADGTVVLDLNNKMLLVSGKKLGEEVIHGVVAISATSESYAISLKEEIVEYGKEYWHNRERYSRFLESIQRMSEAKNFRFYNGYDYRHKEGYPDTGERATLPDNWQNYGYTTDKSDGRRVPSETQNGLPRGVLNFQLKSYAAETDGELLAQHLEENSEAVGEILRRSSEINMNEKTMTRLVSKRLREYGMYGAVLTIENFSSVSFANSKLEDLFS